MPEQDDDLHRIAHDVNIIKGWVIGIGMLALAGSALAIVTAALLLIRGR
jgi:hypothetical protein